MSVAVSALASVLVFAFTPEVAASALTGVSEARDFDNLSTENVDAVASRVDRVLR